jgi:hypothetical protein
MKRLWALTVVALALTVAGGCNSCKNWFAPKGAPCDMGTATPYMTGSPVMDGTTTVMPYPQ